MCRFRLALLLLAIPFFAAAPARAQYLQVYSSYDYNLEPPSVDLFSNGWEISPGQVLAFRFKAQVSGIVNFVQCELYSPSGTGNTCIISLNADEGGHLGGVLTSWNFLAVDTGGFLGTMLYNTNPAAVVVKGAYYWVEIQPFNDDSEVYWAGGYTDAHIPVGTEYQTGHESIDEYTDNVTPNAFDIEIISPGVPYSNPEIPDNYLKEGQVLSGGILSSLGSNAQTPFLGEITPASSKPISVIYDDHANLLLSTGSAFASGIPGYVVKSIDQQPSGFAAVATLASGAGVTRANSTALIAGLSSSGTESYIAARTGTPLSSNASPTIKSFNAIDGNGDDTFFLATLQGTGITAKNSLALCAALTTGTVNILVQKGELIGGKTVETITTLASSALTPASARWRVDGSDIGAELTFTDKSTVLYSIPATNADPASWTRLAGTGDILTGGTLTGAEIVSFGLPGFGPDGVAASALLKTGTGGVTKANDLVLIEWSSTATTLIAVKGDAAPDVTGTVSLPDSFASFGDPICSSNGRLAFPATVTGAHSQGLWWVGSDGLLRLIAKQGGYATGGGQFTKFNSLDFPASGDGPLFTATLAVSSASYVYPGTTEGLWSANQSSGLNLILRQGGGIWFGSTYIVDDFTALTGATGSPGTQRNFETSGTVDVLVDTKSGHTKERYLIEMPY
jgi:hypothetical protein